MSDGTHSLSQLAPAVTFFELPAPFFDAISHIWIGTGGGSACGCELGSARAKEEDEVVKWQRWERGVQRRSYKALPPLFAFKGFWETALRFAPLRILRKGVVGCYLGFHATAAHFAHFSSQFVTAHRIFADFSAIN